MSDGEKTKILIVDDLQEKLLVYRVILDELGQEIVTARSGNEALKQVLAHDFAVILLDVNMPDIDGFETASLIRGRKRSAHTPIIFVTAFADEVRAAEGYAHGAVDYILAPVVPEVLRAKVKVFVELFRMTQQVKRQAEEQMALDLERSRREEAEAANRRLSFSARSGTILGQSLDYRVTARELVRLAVPSFSEMAMLVEPQGNGRWTIYEMSHADDEPSVQENVELEHLPATWRTAIHRCLATTGLETIGTPPETIVSALRARGRTLAALVVSRAGHGAFDLADVTMAEALSSRASIALDNARLYREVEQADRQKNEFLSMLAHELRNPLAPIRNAVEVMRLRGESNPESNWAQDVIDRQVSLLVRLVDDLLDVSRITRGKIRLEMEAVDVAAVVASAVETSRPLIEASGHHLSVEMPSHPLYVNADLARLSQVLANLLNNSAKYTPAGGAIWLRAAREHGDAVFTIRDTGIGIPSEMLAKVFELFTQVERSLDRSQGGLGIGLTLVQRLVELHGGKVSATSAGAGQGSEFTVRIPAIAPKEEPMRSDERDNMIETAAQLRVLVVDDNADAADSLAMLLRLAGHHVRTAYDGPAGLESAKSFQPQAIVLDLGLPGIDGYEVARRLRESQDTSDVLLLALSGYGREEDMRRTSEAGFDHHFIKPVDIAALSNVLAASGCSNGRAKLQAAAPASSVP